MKLHFEPNLDFQLHAVEAVCDLFKGQEIRRTEFTVVRDPTATQRRMEFDQTDLGIGNRLTLLDDQLLKNLQNVQLRNGLAPAEALASGDFTVEMETGTGKTYVYLRTIFELNKRYGFTKFVIVVPSVAIKEGVHKSLQMTDEHFRALYAGVPFEYFQYDSSKMGQVRIFATSPHIQVMVVTVGAINKKDVNNLYKDTEKTGGEKPIDLIKATKPIIIVDEPQSVDGGLTGAGKTALDAMNPLCTLRYSATHANKHHMVYRLDAVDAYERKLVKQIEVAAATIEDAHNKPFVRLLSVHNKKGRVEARVELDVQSMFGVQRKEVTVCDGDKLEQSAKRPIYADYRVGEIRVAKGDEFMELRFPGGEKLLRLGQAINDTDPLAVQREMIRRTIREHLDKEKRLRPQGIKVLSLFFIEQVSRYRLHDEKGQDAKGVYAKMFEEEYRRAAKLPEYNTLFKEIDLSKAAEEVHAGYFSIDKKGGWSEPELDKEGELKNQGSRDDAERAYNLIMREKEKLLSFDTPLKFIFSHSALREGWDNPNVFQICALREIRSERERRQTIGRGLRLCVNQEGQRVRGFEVNTLTVVANESYEQFAEALQKEIEQDTGIRFGIVESHQFAAVSVLGDDGKTSPLGVEKSKELWNHLKAAGYIDAKGKVQDKLKQALKDGNLEVPAEFQVQLPQVQEVLRKLAGKLEIKNADKKHPVRVRKEVLLGEKFKALWDRIKHKSTYRLEFDNEKLVAECVKALRDAPRVTKARLQWRKAEIPIGRFGVGSHEIEGALTVTLDEGDVELPDVLTELQDRTHLTRRTLCRVLVESGRLDDFKRNPQAFIDLADEAINRRKQLAIVDGIKYERLGDGHYYAQELFENQELEDYLTNMLKSEHGLHDYVIYDSVGVERKFAEDLDKNSAVKLYAKLPSWFRVPTPLGDYIPDWAVLIEKDGNERLYFVVETKGSMFGDALRATEAAKIECGKAHFKAIATRENPAKFVQATSLDEVLKHTL